jgi:hypothetical protein
MGNCGWIAIGIGVLFLLAVVSALSGLRLAYAGLKLYLTQRRRAEEATPATSTTDRPA